MDAARTCFNRRKFRAMNYGRNKLDNIMTTFKNNIELLLGKHTAWTWMKRLLLTLYKNRQPRLLSVPQLYPIYS